MSQTPPTDWYYTVEPIRKKVNKQEFDEYLANYPRQLVLDVCGISEPPAISFNDFELADRWPYSIVAYTWKYSDDPDDWYYSPEEEREYYIVSNIEEVFASRTGKTADDWEKDRPENLAEYLERKGLRIKIYEKNGEDPGRENQD